jgi:uncharacterized membrane protein YfhO
MKRQKKTAIRTLSKNKHLTKVTHNYLLWAFMIPFLGMVTVMILGRYEPFGNNYAMLYSDQYHQYFPFFENFRRALRSGESLLYSWDIGMGIDYLGLVSYYLGSPLNLLSVFVPDSLVLEYYALLCPIRLGLASLFFAIFLKKIFNKDDLSIAIFGGFYGLCAWALGYQWNSMWLDTFALLPLVALGTIYLLRDRKFILYTITLFLSIFANYYIGFFTCIFVLLVFICYQICRCTSIKRFFTDLGWIALFSILAIGMTAILELPALAALQNTQSSVNKFPLHFSLNIVAVDYYRPATLAWRAFKDAIGNGTEFFELMGLLFTAIGKSFGPLLDGMRQVAGQMAGAHKLSFMEGLPNLYCGVGTIILAFLFLTAKGIKKRDKICSVSLLVFFMLSFIIRKLDYIWHGFHFTNMIPYRFSFLFSFVLLYMAYRAWLIRDSFKLWQFIVAGSLTLGVMMCADKRFTFIFLSYNLAILLLYLGTYIYKVVDLHIARKKADPLFPEVTQKRENAWKKYSTWALLGIMGLELALSVANFGVTFTATNVYNYPAQKEKTASAIRYMYEREKYSDFFRAEFTHSQTLNDSALNHFEGITTFTSSANVRITEFMGALGFSAKNTYNRYLFEEASPVSNLFLNLKYMIERDGNEKESAYFDTIHNFGKVYLLENNAYLPLGFLAEPELADWDVTQVANSFKIQNDLFRRATGLDEDVWRIPPNDRLTITSTGVTVNSKNPLGVTNYTAQQNGSLRYVYQIDSDGFFCVRASVPEKNDVIIYKNGVEQYRERLSLPQTLAIGDVQVGDTIVLEVNCKAGTEGSVNMRPGILKDQVFRKGYDILAASTLDLTTFSNTRIEGTIDCNRDGLLYTSVPFDGNWEVSVDGKPADVVLIGNCMMGLNLTEGTHTIRFTYKNDTFTIGAIISLVCTGVFIGAIVISRRSAKRKGKYEN